MTIKKVQKIPQMCKKRSRRLTIMLLIFSTLHFGTISYIYNAKLHYMKNLDIKVMRGPNYWSNYRKKLIVLKLDIGELEKRPTNTIEGFEEGLKALIPTLYCHECSEGHEGGFFERVKEGTWMGHVIEHIALEIQTLAGMECGYGRTRTAHEEGIYHVVFSYEIEEAGIYAANAAIRIAEALIKGEVYDLENDLEELRYLKSKHSFGPSTGSIVKEAEKRNIPYKRLNEDSLVTFGYGNKQKKICATLTGNTSGMGIELAGDKNATKHLLAKACIPVPQGILIYDEEDLKEALDKISFPVVLKPVDGNHGRGITTNINDVEQAISAFNIAKTISRKVIVEKFLEGYDYRFLVVNYKLVAVALRTPAMVMGDGQSTISQLIDETNTDPNRGDGHEKVMTKIKIDDITNNILAGKNLSLDSVLPLGEILFLKDTANISTGGTSTDMTDLVHPYNVFIAERVARLLNLDICGIDVVAKDISIPLTKDIGGIVEVNACPGLRMHLNPSKGLPRNVAEPIMDMLFPKEETGRIPVIAVTGTNGKTTTTRLIAHIAKQAGHKVGYTTTEGIYIQDYAVEIGDCTGPMSAETVLLEPSIDLAVLECARGGILRSGLGFDHCDISIVTNVTEDHLGLKDIHNIEDLAKVKGVVARSTFDHGYSILNADDDLVFNMRHELDCNIALFSMNPDNERIKAHCENGGLAAVIEKGYLVICKGTWKTRIEKIKNIPLTLNGRAECMTKNLMPAVLAAVIQGFDTDVIKTALKTFISSPEQTPGRMNIFEFNDFTVMVDYAHNTDGFVQLKKFMDKTPASVKVALVSATGDRRDEDIINIGKICAQTFNEIIIKHDADLRGRSQQEITDLLIQGIDSQGNDIQVKVISSEKEAIDYALKFAEKNAFITILADKIFDVIDQVKSIKLKTIQPPHKEQLEIVNLYKSNN
jgi:cyanophycin synthetase